MRIVCRGYEGKLIRLEASEECVSRLGEHTGPRFETSWFEIEIRTDDGAKITLSAVKEIEICVME